ncbi:MAG: Mu-like prophage major head subunit gpT family protein [Gemmataceae bacterium]
MVAYTGGPMRLAGWRFPVVVDLAGLAIPSPSRPIRLGHDASHGVGHTDAVNVENGKLVASGVVSRDTAAAREVVASSRNGFPWQASIGAGVEEAEFVRENQTVTVNGQEFTGPMNVVRKAVLGEISFVDLGADMQTSARVAAKASGDGAEPPSNPQPTQPSPSVSTAVPATSVATDIRAEVAAETERINAIRRVCNGKHPDIEAKAIREGWDVVRCELEVLRADRPAGPVIVPSVDKSITSDLLEAACALTGKIGRPEDHYEEETLDRAGKRFRGGIGLQELLLEAAWANGFTGRTFRDSREAMRCAFGRQVQAGFSTIDIGGILSNVANKFLLEGFFSVERTWRNITAVRNVSDFKTVTSYRLIGKDQYEQVGPGGELKHGTLGNESYTNKADTYGLMLSIDRRDIINDDLGAITLVPRKLGRGSGLKINDVFWKIFLDNAAFFTVGNKNYISGANTALGIDGLTAAEVTFMEQVDADGKPIGIMPAILLVPPALNAIGSQLFKSMELRDNTASVKYPVTNPHQGKYRVEVSRYLSNTQFTGNSAKAWYLLADANDLPVIEVAFLNGQESPVIETADADFQVLGVQMRGYHDFGVALQDPKAGVKSKGEA